MSERTPWHAELGPVGPWGRAARQRAARVAATARARARGATRPPACRTLSEICCTAGFSSLAASAMVNARGVGRAGALE